MSNIVSIVTSISSIVPSIMMLAKAFSVMMGIYFTGNSLYQYYVLSNPNSAKSMSNQYQVTAMGATVQLIVAACLISFAQDNSVQNIVSSMFGMDTFVMPAAMSYIKDNDLSFSQIQQSLGNAIENIMLMVGSLAIIKALMLARRISLGLSRESYSHVWIFLFTGALCLNIKEFASILDNTFGFHFSKFFY